MRDFTLKTYRRLLETLKKRGYDFITFQDYQSFKLSMLNDPHRGGQSSMYANSKIKNQNSKIIILRHDVDRKPENALRTAQMENELGIKSTYYFRIVPESFDEKIIREIAGLGHEIGYHYEEVDTVYRQVKSKKLKVKSKTKILRQAQNDSGAIEQSSNEAIIILAFELFKKNLEKLRRIVPINTICMHGSPLSPFDNRIIWEKYSYKDLGITGEPYFDMNWQEFAYLTDTGRRWDGESVALRDKVKSKKLKDKNNFKTTEDIIKSIEENSFPEKVMITVHPERWDDNIFLWTEQLVMQNIKNVVKKVIVSRQR